MEVKLEITPLPGAPLSGALRLSLRVKPEFSAQGEVTPLSGALRLSLGRHSPSFRSPSDSPRLPCPSGLRRPKPLATARRRALGARAQGKTWVLRSRGGHPSLWRPSAIAQGKARVLPSRGGHPSLRLRLSSPLFKGRQCRRLFCLVR